MREPTSFADRVQASGLGGKANVPMACPSCGSTFFIKLSAEQFSDGGYGTAQFRSLSNSPESAYVCLCGRLVETKESVGRGMEGQHARFVSAVAVALAAQIKHASEFNVLAKHTASVEDIEALKADIQWLKQSVELLSGQTPVEDEEDEPAGEATIEPAHTEPDQTGKTTEGRGKKSRVK